MTSASSLWSLSPDRLCDSAELFLRLTGRGCTVSLLSSTSGTPTPFPCGACAMPTG